MKHSYYENLLFSNRPLAALEQTKLQAHLSLCKKCQRLDAGWNKVFQLLSATEKVSPILGFSKRWVTSLEHRAQMQRKKFIRSIIWSLAGTAMLCLIVFVALNLNEGSASVFVQRAAHFSQRSEVVTNQVRNFLFIAINKVPPFVWILVLIAFLGWVSIVGVIWFFASRNKRRIKVRYEIDK